MEVIFRVCLLFAGTTACHELAAGYLSSFGCPYEVIGGNHDLEGIDEFSTDEARATVNAAEIRGGKGWRDGDSSPGPALACGGVSRACA